MTTKAKTDKETTAAEEAVEQEFLAKQVGTEENLRAALDELPPEAEQRNIYQYQMSSTETALISPEDFHNLKLSS